MQSAVEARRRSCRSGGRRFNKPPDFRTVEAQRAYSQELFVQDFREVGDFDAGRTRALRLVAKSPGCYCNRPVCTATDKKAVGNVAVHSQTNQDLSPRILNAPRPSRNCVAPSANVGHFCCAESITTSPQDANDPVCLRRAEPLIYKGCPDATQGGLRLQPGGQDPP